MPPDPGRGGSGSGLASGETFDTCLPGPALAATADKAAGAARDFAGVSDDELVGALRAFDKLEAWAGAGKAAASVELARRRPATGRDRARRAGKAAPWGTFCADELAAALAISRNAAERMLAVADDLARRLPQTRGALGEGTLSWYKAQVIAEATRVLDDENAAAAEELILPASKDKTPAQIRDAAGRAVLKVDPEAARKRREEALKDARVELCREDAGTAALCGFHLPPDEALAADQAITALALDLKAAGYPGAMDQLRVRAYLDILLGKDTRQSLQQQAPGTSSVNPDSDPDPGTTLADKDRKTPSAGPEPGASPASAPGEPDAGDDQGADGQHGAPGHDDRGSQTSTAGPPARRTGPAGAAAKINLTIPLATLLGLADHPGEAAGFGPLDAGLARDIAAQAAASPGTSWCLTVTDQHGHPSAHGCAKPARRSRRKRPLVPGIGPPGGRAGAPGTNPPTGAGPPGAGPPGGGPPGGGPPGREPPGRELPGRELPGGYGTWRLRPTARGPDLTVDLEPIPVTDCDHRHQTTAHDPSDRLRHLIQIRDGECTWPPCRRAAERCDFEHAIPWDQGGKTCACNSGPRCRHHHHQKQAAGWRLDQHLPGYHTWTTPSGRQYTNGPISYPV